MNEVRTIPDLFVAGRGTSEADGLHHFTQLDGEWLGRQLSVVEELAALCWHPTLPLIYGLSGLGPGLLHAWDVADVPDGSAVPLVTTDCLGDIPCDLAVDPSGSLLVAASFGSGTLSVWHLDSDGRPSGHGDVIQLVGASKSDPVAQASSHPHQVVFHDGILSVPDYGSDVVRHFAVDPSQQGSAALQELDGTPAPAGTAPRHMVILPSPVADSEAHAAVSGELGSNILVGPLDAAGDEWSVAAGTGLTGPAHTRHERNYPGDIKLGADQSTIYFANRGYDTVSTFDIESGKPVLRAEVDSGVAWPQHLLVTEEWLVIAGWDSSAVVALPLVDGVPGSAQKLFECGGAGWLLADEGRRHQ